jgi:hypothetical protein
VLQYRNLNVIHLRWEDRTLVISNMLTSAYKGGGLRAWKQGTSGQAKEYFLYDGAQVVAELDPTGKVVHAYGFGPNGLAQRYYPNTTGNDFYINYTFDCAVY